MYTLNKIFSTFIINLLKNLIKRVKLIGYYLYNEKYFYHRFSNILKNTGNKTIFWNSYHGKF